MNQDYRQFFREFFGSRMKNFSVPSLQHETKIKIAIELWNQIDVREWLLNFQWSEIEMETILKVDKLPIPEHLKMEFLSIITSIGIEIKSYWRFLRRQIDITKLPNRFLWTREGTIDRKRTAEMIVQDEDLNLNTRYKLACVYCFEDKISELWNRIPEQQKLFYTNRKNRNKKMHNLVEFWTYHLIGKIGELNTIILRDRGHRCPSHVYPFHCAVENGNVVATEFFFGKLRTEARDPALSHYTHWMAQQRLHSRKRKDGFSEVFFYLLSEISENQQVRLLVEFPFEVLSWFLDSPYQHFFINLAEQIMPMQSIVNKSYILLLLLITKKVQTEQKDFDYLTVFRHFWHLSPVTHKRCIIENQPMFSFIVFYMLEHEEKAIASSLFEHANAVDKERFISSAGMLEQLVRDEKWELLDFFIEVCNPKKKVLVRVEKMKKRHLRRIMKRTVENIECDESSESDDSSEGNENADEKKDEIDDESDEEKDESDEGEDMSEEGEDGSDENEDEREYESEEGEVESDEGENESDESNKGENESEDERKYESEEGEDEREYESEEGEVESDEGENESDESNEGENESEDESDESDEGDDFSQLLYDFIARKSC